MQPSRRTQLSSQLSPAFSAPELFYHAALRNTLMQLWHISNLSFRSETWKNSRCFIYHSQFLQILLGFLIRKIAPIYFYGLEGQGQQGNLDLSVAALQSLKCAHIYIHKKIYNM